MNFEKWQNGELPPAGIDGKASGGMEYWQVGELPPVWTLVTVVALVIADASHSQTVDNVALTQHNILAVADASHSQTVDALVLGLSLVIADAAHGHSADNIALTQHGALAVQDAEHGHAADNVALVQHNVLVVADAEHAQTVDNVALGLSLIIADATHGHTADSIALTQHHVLAIDDALHAQTVDALVLGLSLIIADASHDHTADNVVLSVSAQLVIQDASHGHSADNLALIQHNVLAIADATQAQNVDSLSLGLSLAIADATHGHSAENVSLVQHSLLAIADASHSQTVDNVALGVVLIIADASHAQSVDGLALVQHNILTIADATHGQTVDSVALTQHNVLAVQDASHGHSADNIALVQHSIFAKTGTFTIASSDTATTTQQITVGFQSKIIFFWTVGHSSTTDALTNQTARYAFGAAASTSARYAVGSISTDASLMINAGRVLRNDACLAIPLSTSAVDGLLDISAIDSTSFTVIVDDQFSTSVRISYLAVGGNDISEVSIGNYSSPTATGNSDVTALAFQPDFLLLFGAASTTAPNTTNANQGALTIGAAASATQRGVIAVGEGPELNAVSQSRSYAYDAEIWATLADTPTTIGSRADFVSFLSNGFRLNWLEAATAYQVFYVAVKGGGWRVGNLVTQTDTSTAIAKSGFGFAPVGTMLFSHGQTKSTQDTVQDHARLSIGAFTSTSERVAQSMLQESGLVLDTSVTNAIEYDETYINISTAPAVQGLMDVQSIDSDGFTLIMDDADTAQAFAWFFSVGPLTILNIADAEHGHTVDNLSLTQHNILAIQDASHSQTVDSLALVQHHILTIADASHGQTVDNLTLSIVASLVIQDAAHGQTVDGLVLVHYGAPLTDPESWFNVPAESRVFSVSFGARSWTVDFVNRTYAAGKEVE